MWCLMTVTWEDKLNIDVKGVNPCILFRARNICIVNKEGCWCYEGFSCELWDVSWVAVDLSGSQFVVELTLTVGATVALPSAGSQITPLCVANQNNALFSGGEKGWLKVCVRISNSAVFSGVFVVDVGLVCGIQETLRHKQTVKQCIYSKSGKS